MISLRWAQRIWRWTLLLIRQRRCGITSSSWLAHATWGIALRLCLLCSANSCRGSRCPGCVISWTLCCHNSPQSEPPGRTLLGPYGLPTTYVLPHMRMDIRFSQGYHRSFLYVAWPHSPRADLLFSDPQMVYPVDVNEFQGQAVHRLNQQHVQLGLRKGMAVLVYYRVQRGPHVNEVFQAVLIAHESTVTRGKKTENKLWKRVVPSETEFAWLPPAIAWAFCSDALRRRRDCQYLAFHEAHMGLQGRAFQANIFIVDMVFLGDTRSAEELSIFTNMAPERLCLGCGLRVEEKFTPIFPGERGPLFTASVKLLQFALRVSSASASGKGLTEEEEALRQAIRPLVTNPDCHFLAVLTVLVQSILEGRTDCPISGVFGAGKTRAAAAMIASLMVMDPTLKVMAVTKENAAAHAFAKHIESLQLPPEEKFGRLVGATELEKGPASQTKLDVLPGSRNTVLRTKQVIIGCGGGFHQECTQPYSPVARWMSDVDVDEGQQFGNLDEASAIARVPRKGLVVWCGGLRKSDEARAFRRKLMRRPIALRGDTKFIPPHMLGAIVHPYVQDVPGPQMEGSFMKAPGSHWDCPMGVLQFFKNCAKKLLAVAGMQALLRVAAQRLRCCGWPWPPKGSRYKLTPSAALQAQLGNKSGPWFYLAVQGCLSSPMSQSLERDIQNWILSKMILYSLATTSKRSNAPEVAFYPYSGMRHTATSMPALTLGKLWTGSQTSLWWPTKVILQYSTTATKWSMPLPTRNGFQALVEQSSRVVSRPVLEWRPASYCLLKPEWGSSVEDEGKASTNSHRKNRLPKEKRPMQGPLWPSLEHRRSVSSWAHWTCVDW